MAADDLLIVAGEASGDLHGSRLLAAIRRRRPSVRAFGLGGERLAAAGMELLAAAEETSAVGLAEVAAVLPRAYRVYRRLLAAAERRGATTAVLIDFPEFNLRLARALRRRGVRVVYYVSPQIWAWRRGRVRQVERWVDRMLVLFPFEREFYRRHGVEVITVGHPLVDEVPELEHVWDQGPPADGHYRIALLPGSRHSEIRRILPALVGTAEWLAARLAASFVLVRAETVPPGLLAPYLEDTAVPIEVVCGDRFVAVAGSHLALCASGTATLELALVGTPMIVTYRVGLLSYLLSRVIVGLRMISLVNLLLGERVVPELVQREARPDRLGEEALRLLRDPPRVEAMRRQLRRVRGLLGEGGASDRAAAEVLAVLEGGA